MLWLAAAWAWSDPSIDAAIDWPEGWEPVQGEALVENQSARYLHRPTGGGALVRAWSLTADDLPARAHRRIGEVDAALSADLYIVALATNQEDGSAEHTVYLGPSDVVGPRVGRWVFRDPDDPQRIWWHAVWRTEGHFAQIMAWAPVEQLHRFVPAMRSLETRLSTVSGTQPPAVLLHVRDQGCEGPASVDRMQAIAASASLAAARATPLENTSEGRISELKTLSALFERARACLPEAAKSARACRVYERPSSSARTERLQQALIGCLDRRDRRDRP